MQSSCTPRAAGAETQRQRVGTTAMLSRCACCSGPIPRLSPCASAAPTMPASAISSAAAGTVSAAFLRAEAHADAHP
eukprot:6188554-Pleurochrysis_carterae.AAC.1